MYIEQLESRTLMSFSVPSFADWSRIALPNSSGHIVPAANPVRPGLLLFNAICVVETRGNENAIGDNGNAFGIVQIHQAVLDDVNRINHTNIQLKDCLGKQGIDISFHVWEDYLTYWGAKYQQNTGKIPTPEVFARMWNGGPDGWEKSSTKTYWKRVNSNYRGF